jgi:[CysO sulfur-carrier protein]-S-L-cysteine hydrolase
MLQLSASAYGELIAHMYNGAPLEACGLLVGPHTDRADVFVGTANAAASARIYEIPAREHLRAERDAEDQNKLIIGVVHSHTHTDPVPSPTDVAMAPDPSWHYVIVSLRDEAPMLRSFRIIDGVATEEPVSVTR